MLKRFRAALSLSGAALLLCSCNLLEKEGALREKAIDFSENMFARSTVTVPVFVTSTPTFTASPTPTASATPTETPTPTATPVGAGFSTPTFETVLTAELPVSVNDSIRDVSDITIPDDTVLRPGEIFIKSWRMTNGGLNTWEEGTRLLLDANYNLDTPEVVQAIFLKANDWIDTTPGGWGTRIYNVSPGSEVDLAVLLRAPSTPGSYEIQCRLMNTWGEIVSTPFWMSFQVLEPTPTPEGFTETSATDAYDWSGRWMVREPLHAEGIIPLNAWFYQNGSRLEGFFYDSDGNPVIITGTVSESGRDINGEFHYPWHNESFPIHWRMQISKNQFYAVTNSGRIDETAICGGRNGKNFPSSCTLPGED